MDFADGPTLQLRHDHFRINLGLAAGVDIDTEIVRGERWGDVQLIDDRLRQERQVLENHSFLRLERDGAVNEPPLPAASRDHQRGFVPGVESQHLKCRAHLEAWVSQPARQSHGVLGIAVPIDTGLSSPRVPSGLDTQLFRQRCRPIQEQGHPAFNVVEDGLNKRGGKLLPFLFRNNQQRGTLAG